MYKIRHEINGEYLHGNFVIRCTLCNKKILMIVQLKNA